MGAQRNKKIGIAVLALALSPMVLLFQNCTAPLSGDGTDALTSQAEKAPFGYDATIDQVAYMSCNNVKPEYENGSAFFTIRAGAYGTAGLKLNDTFLNYVKLKPAERQFDILTTSPANKSTVMQLAVRPKSNLQTVVTSSATPVAGTDYVNFLTALGASQISTALLGNTNGTRINRMRDGTVVGARMEGNLIFDGSYTQESSIRTAFQTDVLALTFTQGGSGTNDAISARAPQLLDTKSSLDSKRYVYGKGLSISFTTPAVSSLNSHFPSTVMSSVTEADLSDPNNHTNTGQWICPATMQFRIIRAADVGNSGTNCVKGPDSASPSSDLQIVRRSLRNEEWYVDMANRCIIPKVHGSGCYGDYTTVVYNMSDTCNTSANSTCVAYASVCYRMN